MRRVRLRQVEKFLGLVGADLVLHHFHGRQIELDRLALSGALGFESRLAFAAIDL